MKIYVSLSKKNKKLLKYAILFILGCILIYYSSILNVKAESQYVVGGEANVSMPSFARFYDIPSSNSVTAYSTSTSLTYAYTASLPQTAGGTGSLITFTPSTPIATSTLYALTIYVGYNSGSIYPTTSSLARLAVGSSLGDSANSFASGGNCSIYYRANSTAVSSIYVEDQILDTGRVFYIFSCSSNGEAISVPYTASQSGTRTNYFYGYDIEVLGSTSGLTSSDVQNVIDNSNLASSDSIDQVQENITSVKEELTETTKDIIDNQNKNNEEVKEEIKDGFNTCEQKNLLDKSKYVVLDGVIGLDLSLLEKGKTYTFSSSKPIEELKISERRSGSVYPGLYKYTAPPGFTEFTFTMPTDKDTSSLYMFLYLPPNDTIVSSISQLDGYNLQIEEGSSATSYVEPKEVCTNKIDETNDKLDNLNDNITSSDTSGADSEANSFFNDFEDNDFGLSDILTLPLTTIESITSKTCSPLSLTLPFVNKTFELPCMTTIYSKFEPFYSIYKTITFGIVAYWICVQIYAMVKGFKDPTSDEIEVMDL